MRLRTGPLALLVLAVAASACGDDDRQVVGADGDLPAATAAGPADRDELALPLCDDLPSLGSGAEVAEPSSDPEVAGWQEGRAGAGMASDEAATLAAADDPATEPLEAGAMGFPMTQAEADDWFGFQAEADAVGEQVRALVGAEPWFNLIFIDHVERTVGVLVDGTADRDEVQARLDAELGEGTTRVVTAPHSNEDLAAAQAAAVAHLQAEGIRFAGIGSGNLQGVVTIGLEVLDPAVVAGLADVLPAGIACVTGADPTAAVPEGPQPQEGDGWRLLADEPGIGMAYATGAATDQAAYDALWAQIGLPGEPPPVDFADEVVLWFGPAVSGSCSDIRLDDVVLDEATATLRPEIVLPGGDRACTADANPHAYVVAYERARLPERFVVTVAPNEQCCPEATTEVDLPG